MNALRPHGPDAGWMADLFWLMLVIGGAIYVVTMLLLGTALFRRRGPGNDNAFIVAGGVVLPTVVLAVLAFATVRTTNDITRPRTGAHDITVDVTAYQYWWRVAYADYRTAVTANEVHVPVGGNVRLELTSADVIHSFWIPDLAGKVDAIPGRRTVLNFRADRAGTYRGQCAEFCGLQHTHMALLVIAEPPTRFDDWLRTQSRPAATSSAVFDNATCAGCHTIRGTLARGTLGPDLTHLDGRRTLGAVTVPNTHDNLAAWIRDAQQLKPGSRMPPVPLSDADLQAILAYLETLD